MADSRLEVVLAAKDISAQGFASFKRGISSVTGAVFSLQGAMAGLGIAFGARGILDAGRSFERFETQLATLTGSAAAAKASMDWITEFTSTTPYELDEVTGAFAKLTAYGLNATDWMRTLGDTASSMGKSINDAVEMFADAVTGEFERLKEFGVRAKQQGDQVTFSWSQNGQDMTLTAEKTQSGISNALGKIFSRFQGGMEEQARTFDGLWSNMMDTITGLERRVLNAGLFDEIKEDIRGINGELTDWIDNNGELIEQKVPEYIDNVKSSMKGMYDFYQAIPEELVNAAGYGILGRMLFGGWGPAKIVAGVALVNDAMKTVSADVGSLADQYDKVGKAWGRFIQEVQDVASGRKDWWTGNIKSAANRREEFDRGDVFYGTSDFQAEDAKRTIAVDIVSSPNPAPPPAEDLIKTQDMLDGIDRELQRFFGEVDDIAAGVNDELARAFDDLDIEQKEIGIDLELDDFFGGLDAAQKKMEASYHNMLQLSQRTADAVEQTFSDYFFDAFTGKLDDLGDYWEGLMNSMKRVFADTMGQIAKEAIFGPSSGGGIDFFDIISRGFGFITGINLSGSSTASTPFFSSDVYGTYESAADFKLSDGGYLGEEVRGVGMRSGSSYQFHPNEFVVPMSKMGGGAGGGDTYNIYTTNNYHAIDSRGMEQLLRQHQVGLADNVIESLELRRSQRNRVREII